MCDVRAVAVVMPLVLVVRRKVGNGVLLASVEAHHEGGGEKRVNKACHGARESSGRGTIAKRFVLSAGRSAEAAPGGRRLVHHNLRQPPQLRRKLFPEPEAHVLDGGIL